MRLHHVAQLSTIAFLSDYPKNSFSLTSQQLLCTCKFNNNFPSAIKNCVCIMNSLQLNALVLWNLKCCDFGCVLRIHFLCFFCRF